MLPCTNIETALFDLKIQLLIMSITAPYVLEHTEVDVGRQGSAGWHSAAGSTPEWLALVLRLLPTSSQR